MSHRPLTAGPPGRLLVATDLSARSDRALERAAQLTRQWTADLTAVTVLESFATAPDLLARWITGREDEVAQIAREELQEDLAALDVQANVRLVQRDDPADAILEVAAATDSGLVMTGVARYETLGRIVLGSTVKRLARTLPQPLLVVRTRVHGPYRRVVVATDFSEPSRQALHAAARFFPECELIVYHGTPMTLTPSPSLAREIKDGECALFLAGSDLPVELRERLQIVIKSGRLALSLAKYVRDNRVDLAVVGTQGRSWLSNVLLGSTAAELLDWLPCDTMTIRHSRGASEAR